jgi:hypothetical protein
MRLIQLMILLLIWPLTVLSEPVSGTSDKVVKTKLFVLGTPHLSSWKEKFKPELLDSTIAKLAAFKPDAIMVEAMPGTGVAALQLRGPASEEVLKSYGRRQVQAGEMAQEALDIEWGEAYNKVADFNQPCPEGDSAMQCILTYLAAFEYDTALLQYVKLDSTARADFDEKHPAIAEKLQASLKSTNEYYTIAQRLALELGHSRLFPVDAHAEKVPFSAMLEADPSMEGFYGGLFGDFSKHPYIVEMDQRQKAGVEAGDLLAYYRWQNSPGAMEADFEVQWTPFIAKDNDAHFGKARLAFWEMRNYLTAANMARVMAEFPGGNLLYITGSGHKPFLDQYFRATNWVEVMDTDAVLGTDSSEN